jgi:2-polyprenyl-3-methyl-5-hydroxy-6-metoxy-1,4-benzoquinol methylase
MSSLGHLVEVRCNICNSNEKEIISRADKGNIVRCKRCGLFYKTPRLPDKNEINKYKSRIYNNSFYNIENRAKKNIYISVLKKIENYKGKMLDIGCSNGYFLTLARQRGWKPYGVEISDLFLKKAKDNLGEDCVFGIPLREVKFPSNFFDVITMWDVLDHLMDPFEELMEIRRILRKEGLLVIRVRNMSFHILINRLFRKNLLGIVKKPAVFHLYGFNNQNIRILLNKAHFTKILIKNSKLTVGDPYSQINLLGNYTANFVKGIYWAFSEFIGFLSLQNINISPSLIVYAEKT